MPRIAQAGSLHARGAALGDSRVRPTPASASRVLWASTVTRASGRRRMGHAWRALPASTAAPWAHRRVQHALLGCTRTERGEHSAMRARPALLIPTPAPQFARRASQDSTRRPLERAHVRRAPPGRTAGRKQRRDASYARQGGTARETASRSASHARRAGTRPTPASRRASRANRGNFQPK